MTNKAPITTNDKSHPDQPSQEHWAAEQALKPKAASEVQRYALHDAKRGLVEDATGNWVQVTDHWTVTMERDELRKEIERLRSAIGWALGEGDSDFGDNKPTVAGRVGAFWWRTELRERAYGKK